MTAISRPTDMSVDMSLRGLDRGGQLRLDALITRGYTLDDVNQGYADIHSGINVRGLIRY